MSDVRPDLPHGSETTGVVRDAKIEELLLVGLDQYFAGHYEQAIHVWTRVLFLDRGHARARAYIERARSAIAEHQRESEELLQTGLAALPRGPAGAGRPLDNPSGDRAAASDVALAFLSRVHRRDAIDTESDADVRARSVGASRPAVNAVRAAAPWRLAWLIAALTLVVGVAAIAFARGSMDWISTTTAPPRAAAIAARTEPLRVPRVAETALARARTLFARGHLNQALVELESIGLADPLRADADRLKADIERALLETVTLAPGRRPVP
jgi:hypothetical protein